MSEESVTIELPPELVALRNEAAERFNRLPVAMQMQFVREALAAAGQNAISVFGQNGFRHLERTVAQTMRQLSLLAGSPAGRA